VIRPPALRPTPQARPSVKRRWRADYRRNILISNINSAFAAWAVRRLDSGWQRGKVLLVPRPASLSSPDSSSKVGLGTFAAALAALSLALIGHFLI
jgi:hypothetical protein